MKDLFFIEEPGISFLTLLAGGDLRSLGNTRRVISVVNNKSDFERLFKLIFNYDRPVAMRASDAIEKVTKTHPEYLDGHDRELLELARTTANKELNGTLRNLYRGSTFNRRNRRAPGIVSLTGYPTRMKAEL